MDAASVGWLLGCQPTQADLLRWGLMASRCGVPTRALVVRPDSRGVWGVSDGKTLAAVTEALSVRLEELRKLELPDTAFLPMTAQVRAQQELQKRWRSWAWSVHVCFSCVVAWLPSLVRCSQFSILMCCC